MAETTLGALFNNDREVAWRRFSGVKTFDTQPGKTVTQAINEMGLNFQVETTPLHTVIDGQNITVPGRTAIVRTDGTPKVFGTTGTEYKPLQNADLARLLDPLVEKWSLDSVASKYEGRDMIVAFKTEASEVNGEPLQEYFWGVTSHDGLSAVRFLLIPVRLFCTNQLISGLKRASFRAQISHNQSVQSDAAFQLQVFNFMEDARKTLHLSFEKMGNLKLTQEQIDDVILKVHPDPKMPRRVEVLHLMAAATAKADGSLDDSFREALDADSLAITDNAYLNYEREMDQVKIVRKDTATLLEKFNDEHPGEGGKLANSGWALYNAIVELADYRGTAKFSESVAVSSLMGNRAAEKERGFNQVMAIVAPGWSESAVTTEGMTSVSDATRRAKAAARASLSQDRALRAEQKAAERQARLISEGKIKPRFAEDGVTILPPLTPEERLAERLTKEAEELKKLEERLNARKAKQVDALKGQEARLAQRKADAEARAVARAEALKERADAINATPANTALTPDAPELDETPEPLVAHKGLRK